MIVVALTSMMAICSAATVAVRSLDEAQARRHLLNRLPAAERPALRSGGGDAFVDAVGLTWTKLPRARSLFHHPDGLVGNLLDWLRGRPERYWKFDSAFRNSNGMWSSYEATWDAQLERWVPHDGSFNLCAPLQHGLCHTVVDVLDFLLRADAPLPTLEQLQSNVGQPHPDLSHALERWHVEWLVGRRSRDEI